MRLHGVFGSTASQSSCRWPRSAHICAVLLTAALCVVTRSCLADETPSAFQIAVQSGDDQGGAVNSILPNPLEVKVTTAGVELADALVTFSLVTPEAGGGLTDSLTSTSFETTYVVQTDSSGLAQAYYHQPSSAGTITSVSVCAEKDGEITSSVLFTASTYADTVTTPVISIEATTIPYALRHITITCATTDAEVHYTTNSLEPSTDDTTVPQDGTFTIDHPAVIRARAFKSGWNPSTTTSSLCSG